MTHPDAKDCVSWEDGRGVLLLYGGPGTFTLLHMDFGIAINVGFRVFNKTPPQEELEKLLSEDIATWLFIQPSIRAVDRVNAFLDMPENARIKAKFPGGCIKAPALFDGDGDAVRGGALPPRVKALTREEMLSMAAGCGEITLPNGKDVPCVQVVGQKHGEVIVVPPGYMHMVINNHTNLKMACELRPLRTATKMCVAQAWLGPKLFGAYSSEDYVSYLEVVKKNVEDTLKSIWFA